MYITVQSDCCSNQSYMRCMLAHANQCYTRRMLAHANQCYTRRMLAHAAIRSMWLHAGRRWDHLLPRPLRSFARLTRKSHDTASLRKRPWLTPYRHRQHSINMLKTLHIVRSLRWPSSGPSCFTGVERPQVGHSKHTVKTAH